MTIHIDRSLFNNGYIPLTIDLPDSSSPSRYGSTERRVLGFYFLSLHVRADNTLALSLQRLFSLNPIPRRVAAACHGPRRVARRQNWEQGSGRSTLSGRLSLDRRGCESVFDEKKGSEEVKRTHLECRPSVGL